MRSHFCCVESWHGKCDKIEKYLGDWSERRMHPSSFSPPTFPSWPACCSGAWPGAPLPALGGITWSSSPSWCISVSQTAISGLLLPLLFHQTFGFCHSEILCSFLLSFLFLKSCHLQKNRIMQRTLIYTLYLNSPVNVLPPTYFPILYKYTYTFPPGIIWKFETVSPINSLAYIS